MFRSLGMCDVNHGCLFFKHVKSKSWLRVIWSFIWISRKSWSSANRESELKIRPTPLNKPRFTRVGGSAMSRGFLFIGVNNTLTSSNLYRTTWIWSCIIRTSRCINLLTVSSRCALSDDGINFRLSVLLMFTSPVCNESIWSKYSSRETSKHTIQFWLISRTVPSLIKARPGRMTTVSVWTAVTAVHPRIRNLKKESVYKSCFTLQCYD